MGTTQGSDLADPIYCEPYFAIYFRPITIKPVTKLLFILPEAMVNYKKMVHPPCRP